MIIKCSLELKLKEYFQLIKVSTLHIGFLIIVYGEHEWNLYTYNLKMHMFTGRCQDTLFLLLF